MPLTVAAPLFAAMSTWWRGRSVARKLESDTLPLRDCIAQVHNKRRVLGAADPCRCRLPRRRQRRILV